MASGKCSGFFPSDDRYSAGLQGLDNRRCQRIKVNTSVPSDPQIEICLAQLPVGETNPLSARSRSSQTKRTVRIAVGLVATGVHARKIVLLTRRRLLRYCAQVHGAK
jgi:hypothetical protein